MNCVPGITAAEVITPESPQLTHCLFKLIGNEAQVMRGHLRWNFSLLAIAKGFSASLTDILRAFLCFKVEGQR